MNLDGDLDVGQWFSALLALRFRQGTILYLLTRFYVAFRRVSNLSLKQVPVLRVSEGHRWKVARASSVISFCVWAFLDLELEVFGLSPPRAA